LRPGRYDLAAMVDFADLPPLLPRHAVVKNCYWIDGDGSKVNYFSKVQNFVLATSYSFTLKLLK
jgi:hypothetical protein